MISQQVTPLHPLNKILSTIAAVFATGVALLLLNAFQEALTQYSALIMRILALSAVILILSFVTYVSVNIYLTIEYRATQNEIFKQSQQELLSNEPTNESPELDTERRILELYDDMTFHNSLSMNQIALAVYGKKGGYYNNQIREILTNNGREI